MAFPRRPHRPCPATVETVPPGPDDPQATALANVYVRTGPATNFPAFSAWRCLTGRVIGVSEKLQWWVVRLNPWLRRPRLRLGDGRVPQPGQQRRLCADHPEPGYGTSTTAIWSSRSDGNRICKRAHRPWNQLPGAGCGIAGELKPAARARMAPGGAEIRGQTQPAVSPGYQPTMW